MNDARPSRPSAHQVPARAGSPEGAGAPRAGSPLGGTPGGRGAPARVPTPQGVTGVILAGGQATRYDGRAKGLERVGGRRVIDRVADALAQVTDELLVIANHPGASDWLPGVRTEADVRPGCGSLGGIHAAVVHAGRPSLVVAWDMPFVSGGLLRALRDLGDNADVVVPESDSRRGVEPLCAFYTPACAAPIERRLDSGDLRVVGFYDEIRLVRLEADLVRRFGDPTFLFMNINTPDDLELAEQYASTLEPRPQQQKA